MKKAKAALREQSLLHRNRQPVEVREAASQKAANLFKQHKLHEGHKIVSAYWPVHGEFDVTAVFTTALHAGLTGALPVIHAAKSPLLFRHYAIGDTLLKDTRYDIYEPLEKSPVVTPDLLLVPLLAFDRKGYRLGLGGGYYDRTLEALKKDGARFTTIGIGYAECEVEKIPHELHDMPMDMILTEKELIKVAA